MSSLSRKLLAVVVLLAAAVAGAPALGGGLDPQQFQRDLEAMTRWDHRLAGYGSEARIEEMARRVLESQATSADDRPAADIFRETTRDVLEYLNDPQYIEEGPGSLAASKYVQQRLTDIQSRLPQDKRDDLKILTQEFDVVQAVSTECRAEMDGESYELFAARPNGVVARVTPAEGLTGPLLFAGEGRLEDYGQRDPNGTIVVLNHDGDWEESFAFGTKAVLIIGNGSEPGKKYSVDFPANLPVFYVPLEAADRMGLTGDPETFDGESITLFAACQWRLLRGRNVVAVLRGTDPQMGQAGRENESLLLAAPLDSLSEFPLLSPGARDAANAAALLQLASYLVDERPRRDTVFCFFDGQTISHRGARSFYQAARRPMNKDIKNYDRAAPGDPLDEREEGIQSEYEFQDFAIQLLSQEDIFEPDTDALNERRNELLKRVSPKWYLHVGKICASPAVWATGIVLAGLVVVLTIVRLRLESVAGPLRLANQMAFVLGLLAWTALAYGSLIDPALFEDQRKAQEQEGQYERRRLDQVTKQIEGLENSHRTTMDMLRDEARMRDSDVLDLLRPARLEVERLRNQIERDTEALEAIRPTGSAEEIAAAEKALAGLQAATERQLDLRDRLAVEDMLWNTCLRIIQKKSTPADIEDNAIPWSEALADKGDADRQEAMRSRFQKLLIRGVFDGDLGQWRLAREDEDPRFIGALGQLKRTVVQGCEVRKTELLLRAIDVAQSKEINRILGVDRMTVVMHVSINLGDERSRWTLIHGDRSSITRAEDSEGIYQNRAFKAARRIADELGATAEGFDVRAISGEYQNQLFSGPGVDSSAVARIVGVGNLSVMTVMDYLPRQGQVTDVLDALNPDMVLTQLRHVAPFLRAFADCDELNSGIRIPLRAKFDDLKWQNNRLNGVKISRASSAQAMRQHPVPGSVLVVYSNYGPGAYASVAGQVAGEFAMANSRGFCEYGPVDASKAGWWGRYHVAADFDEHGRGIVRAISNAETVGADAVTIFPARSMTMVNYGFAASGGAAPMASIETATMPAKTYFAAGIGQSRTIYASDETDSIKVFNLSAFVILNNEPSRELHPGIGIPLADVADEFSHPVALQLSARDLGILNEYRLKLLSDARINQDSLQMLNSQAKDWLDDAETAGIAGAGLPAFAGDVAASAALSRRTYTPLRMVMEDLVVAVVLLLLLAVPFAYAMERLIIGTPHIYRQIGWFGAFFLSTFVILYLVNPAFRIASTPIIIFLAFTIVVLATMVISVLVRKLQTEVKAMQGLGQTVHSTDVSRVSTMAAAVMMGVSTMRRRPLRTFLTATTVVLLTFTILTFASFGVRYDNRRDYKGTLRHMPPRIMVRDAFWNAIDVGALEVLRGHLRGEATVVPRYWMSPTAASAQSAGDQGVSLDKLLTDESTEHMVAISAGIGLDLRDVEKQPALDAMFEAGADRTLLAANGIYLTRAVAEELDLTDADIGSATLRLSGETLIFGGIISDQLGSFESLEGSRIVPVDFEVTAGAEDLRKKLDVGGEQGLKDPPEIDSAQFAVLSLDRVVVFGSDVDFTRRVAASIRSLTIYPDNPADVPAIADRVARIAALPTYYGYEGEVYRTTLTSVADSSGIKELLIPVCLGGLIIFATMLGSVSDREREIYTFSSLGLAPAHVASLFFAEASVYAVVGGMGGYLLGQTVARVLSWVSTFANISVPAMNYSSFNAIATIMVVMGTVLISTIYPAIKASRSANPGIQRSWRIPHPEAGLYDLIFPFTVSAYDITGVVSFLKEHFDNYTDTSLGIMATSECHIYRQENTDQIGITAAMALAPFDLGVNQRFALLSQPSEIEGIDEIRILIQRHTGTRGDWMRANRVFINDLRKQLLIWRSLTTEVMDEYRQKTLDAWDSLKVQRVDETTIGEMA